MRTFRGECDRSSLLERRCRRLLAAYPAGWRAAHGDELLGVLMDTAPTSARRPTVADAADVVFHGVVVRWRAATGGAAGGLCRDGLRLAGAIAFTLIAALGSMTVIAVAVHPASLLSGTPVSRLGIVAGACYAASFASAIRGSRRWAVVSFLAADLFGLAAATLVFALGPAESTPRTLPVAAAALLAVEATVFVVSRPAGAGGACWPSPRRWLVTCVAVVALGEAAHPWGALAVTNGVGDARVSLIVFLVMVVGVLGSAAAAAIDPRLLLAVLALLAPASPFLVVIAARMAGPGGHGSVAVGLIVAVLLGLAGEARWAVGRRARLTH